MLDIIQNNPYRLLGIYSNSPIKERVANHNRLKAFLKVGKEVSFPLDLLGVRSTMTRTTAEVSDAEAKLTLPNEQLKYAQFWFVKVTPLDDVAINHLIVENINGAISIWEKKENVSSLQNRIVCALITDNYALAIACAYKLYSSYTTDFVHIVLGDYQMIDTGKLAYDFLDVLCSAIGAQKLLPYLAENDWKHYVRGQAIKPLIETLQSAIDIAKASNGKGITARYNAGAKLMNVTKEELSQLKGLLSVADLQYQMIADKLGLEILQCGIDYYNGSEAADAARKAMKLQAYAQSVVIGKMAKDRCKENVDILQKIIDNLPPAEVFAEDKAIKEELRKFCQLPDKICYAVTLLNKAKPHLQSIKAKLGANNSFYLKLSTQVVGNALHNIIEEVNAVQQDAGFGPRIDSLVYIQVKSALKSAWEATKIMDAFDMESDFKTNRYNQNRSILKNMCEQLGISTSTHPPRPTLTSYTTQATSSPTMSETGNATIKSSDNSGCIIGIVCVAASAVIGGVVAGGGCAVFGAVIGLIIYETIVD